MKGCRKVRVLIVDDSLVSREILSRGLSSDPWIEVVATATDPFDARDKILKYKPDVMTCDVAMPKMNGIEFIKRLIPQYPLPVIVISTASGAVFDAMSAGAVEFVAKPDMKSPKSVENFINEIISKIKIAAAANMEQVAKANSDLKTAASCTIPHIANIEIVAIGASTGGTQAISSIIKALPANVPGIVIVQHIPSVFSRMFAERLNKEAVLTVKEAQTGDRVERGIVLIAPGDQHMRIQKVGDQFRIECFAGEKVSGHCPSVDVLFESVAKEAGSKAIGIILTGMGYDGAKGLLAMKRKGAKTIGQDEKSSVVYGMPKVAFDSGAVGRQAALTEIPQLLYSLLR